MTGVVDLGFAGFSFFELQASLPRALRREGVFPIRGLFTSAKLTSVRFASNPIR